VAGKRRDVSDGQQAFTLGPQIELIASKGGCGRPTWNGKKARLSLMEQHPSSRARCAPLSGDDDLWTIRPACNAKQALRVMARNVAPISDDWCCCCWLKTDDPRGMTRDQGLRAGRAGPAARR